MCTKIEFLYDYQNVVFEAVTKAFQKQNRVLFVMACGLGKTIVSVFYAKEQLAKNKKGLFLCHDTNILKQAEREYGRVIDGSFKFFHGNEKDWDSDKADIVFATFQMLNSANPFLEDEFDFIIVDESHHSKADTYFSVIDYFEPEQLLGMTATPNRGDGREIREIFGSEVIDISLEEAIAKNWLTDIEYHMLNDGINQSKLKRIVKDVLEEGKKVSIKQLNETIFIKARDEKIIESIAEFNDNHSKKTIIFCESIEHAIHFHDLLLTSSRTFHSRNAHKVNQKTLSEFRHGDLNIIIAVDKLNEGIDIPDAEVVVFLRSTDSENIFIQQLGRGLRKIPGKDKVIVLDFVANCERVVEIREMSKKITSLANQPYEKGILRVSGKGFDFLFNADQIDILEVIRKLREKIFVSNIPKLAKEYMSPPKNELPVDQVIAGTNKKVWWKCHECEYEWEASGNNRVAGTGCPACAGRVVTEKNNLAVTHPKLAKEYMPPPKNELPVDQVIAGTHRRLWWKCSKCGHEWEASGNSRIRGTGCPACVKQVVTEKNNFSVTHLELAKEYMPPPKNELPADQVIAGTNKKVWWKCSKCGHEWKVSGNKRVNGRGCPACAKQVVTEKNNLAVTHPKLAKEYSSKNELPANQVIAGTSKKVWWKCSKCGHEWEATGNSRIRGTGCPKYREHSK